jgi:transcriptional regulator with XRE-family HTH domain
MMLAMASDPPSLGARIRRARESRRLTQPQLAEAIGVSVRAIGDWENNRTRPKNRLGALEEFFRVSLTGDEEPEEIYTDPVERAIWEDPTLPRARKRALIEQLRAERREHTPRAMEPPALPRALHATTPGECRA